MSKERIEENISYKVEIYIAGDYDTARNTCKRFCMIGNCVSIEKVDYIYKGGEEFGIKATLINYPKFPKETNIIWDSAILLAESLRVDLFQDSYLVMDNEHTFWKTYRE